MICVTKSSVIGSIYTFIRHVCVGHDGRRVAVDQHNLDTFFFQCLASLCSSVVEFRCLPDDNRAGADDENFFNVSF